LKALDSTAASEGGIRHHPSNKKTTHKQTGEEFEAERASNELLKPIKALGN
jgi:hypothetical protein